MRSHALEQLRGLTALGAQARQREGHQQMFEEVNADS
jgi:hypothetical protein